MCGCSANGSRREVIRRMIVEQKLDLLAMSERKFKGMGEYMFGCVNERMTGVLRRKGREGVGLLLSPRQQNCMIELHEVSLRVMWAKVN